MIAFNKKYPWVLTLVGLALVLPATFMGSHSNWTAAAIIIGLLLVLASIPFVVRAANQQQEELRQAMTPEMRDKIDHRQFRFSVVMVPIGIATLVGSHWIPETEVFTMRQMVQTTSIIFLWSAIGVVYKAWQRRIHRQR